METPVMKSSSGGTGFQPVRSYTAGRDARPTDFSGFVGGPTAHEELFQKVQSSRFKVIVIGRPVAAAMLTSKVP